MKKENNEFKDLEIFLRKEIVIAVITILLFVVGLLLNLSDTVVLAIPLTFLFVCIIFVNLDVVKEIAKELKKRRNKRKK